MNAICIIPARLQSTRLPGKLLMTLGEYSIIEHVYRNCVESNVFTKVLIAVDDNHMLEHCATFCDDIIMTKNDHQSGTDRIYEAYQQSGIKADYIVNVQADEPFLNAELIATLVQSLGFQISEFLNTETLYHIIAMIAYVIYYFGVAEILKEEQKS